MSRNDEAKDSSDIEIRSEDWRFDGTPEDFIGMMKWSIVASESKRDPKVLDILTDPNKVIHYAEEMGLTSELIAREAIRLGQMYLCNEG